MKINTNSWHYRFLEFLDREPSENLCWYFWQVVGNLMGFIIVSTMLSILVFTGSFILAMPLLAWLPIWSDPANLFLLSFLSVSIWIVVGGKALQVVRENRIGRDSFLGKSVFPEQSIVRVRKEGTFLDVACQWLKAKKEKVCPRLEFVDEE